MKGLFLLFLLTLPLTAEVGFVEPWGKDRELAAPLPPPAPPPSRLSPVAKAAQLLIYFHQNVISPVDGPRSHFRPSSSQYMLLAIRRDGFLRGFFVGCDRLLRENKEKWVYRIIETDEGVYKWDPLPT